MKDPKANPGQLPVVYGNLEPELEVLNDLIEEDEEVEEDLQA